jgi:hypothetical protein
MEVLPLMTERVKFAIWLLMETQLQTSDLPESFRQINFFSFLGQMGVKRIASRSQHGHAAL